MIASRLRDAFSARVLEVLMNLQLNKSLRYGSLLAVLAILLLVLYPETKKSSVRNPHDTIDQDIVNYQVRADEARKLVRYVYAGQLSFGEGSNQHFQLMHDVHGYIPGVMRRYPGSYAEECARMNFYDKIGIHSEHIGTIEAVGAMKRVTKEYEDLFGPVPKELRWATPRELKPSPPQRIKQAAM